MTTLTKEDLVALDPTFNISFKLDALDLLLEGLAHLPLGKSKALFDALQASAQEQIQAALAARDPVTDVVAKEPQAQEG